ncbi:MAG: reverse transcriptase-like protein [Candidatus Lokiarchaeota archaeon]|nr:reverse transcriptase-like protein [Candidatus Lokiarchaeota archaeon]
MIRIYTDGSCKPTNPGPAGFGVVVVMDGEVFSATGTYIGVATNNVAELKAVEYAMIFLESLGLDWEPSVIVSDSQYVIGLMEKNWIAKKNQELVASMRKRLEGFPNLSFEWVRGHNGDQYNEMADQLAKNIIDVSMFNMSE